MGYERGSISSIANVLPISLHTYDNAELDLDKMEYHASIPENEHTPGVRAICLESSHNGCNGRVLTLDYISKVKQVADKYNKKLYLDGARSWNAAISLGLSPKEMVNDFCLVNVCLAKGFGCPIGSLLVGSEEDIHAARFYRKQLGGAMK